MAKNSSFFSHPYYKNFDSLSKQIQFVEFENYYLTANYDSLSSADNFPFFQPCFKSFFVVPLGVHDTSLNISRVLFAFAKIFHLKPSIHISALSKSYKIYAHCSESFRVNRLVSTYFYLGRVARSKFVRTSYDSKTHAFQFTLKEPITFFPIVNKFFDYHDWSYSLRGTLSFESSNQQFTQGTRMYANYVRTMSAAYLKF